jgi:hypothetical protein
MRLDIFEASARPAPDGFALDSGNQLGYNNKTVSGENCNT